MRIISLMVSGIFFCNILFAQQNNGRQDIAQKVNNAANKVTSIIAVFQPYLLKARQLFYDAKQLSSDVKNSAKNTFGKNGNINNTGVNGSTYTNNNGNTTYSSGYTDTSHNYNNQNGNNNTNNNYNSNQDSYSSNTNGQVNNNNGQTYNNNNIGNNNGSYATTSNPQYYLPNQNLPVNNPATVNNDGTGNWGNQNNGLYGNCLDVLTGTVMGLGEAEAAPKSVDLIFIAANGSYQIWTPNYARNEVAAQYTSRSTTESAGKWSDVNETEIAETRITIGQFDQIQNNSQILNAVKNAQNYGSSVTEFNKLDGKVYAVRAELENRTVYGLVAIVRQVGTDGSNGYLKIKIKAQGIDNNQNGQVNANSYLR
jgi:hypothetical protein